MNFVLKNLLEYMKRQHLYNGKHQDQNLLIKNKIKYIHKSIQKDFWKELDDLIKEGYIIREPHRTGKKDQPHLSINVHKLKEIDELIND